MLSNLLMEFYGEVIDKERAPMKLFDWVRFSFKQHENECRQGSCSIIRSFSDEEVALNKKRHKYRPA